MAKMIHCKACGAEIYKGAKRCPQCGKKNRRPTGIIFIGLVVLMCAIALIAGRVKEQKAREAAIEAKQKSSFAWPTSGIAALLPKPEQTYGKVSSESKDYFWLDVYFVSQDEFNDYVNKCKEKGFTEDYSGSSSYYYANDADGNSLSLHYDEKDEEMSVRITAVEEISSESETPSESKAEEPSESETASPESETEVQSESETPSESQMETQTESEAQSTGNSNDFRAWVDEYEAFMNKYVDFMESYDSTDLKAYTEYLDLLSQYMDFVTNTATLQESDYTLADWKYYMDVQLRVLDKLSKIQ